MMRRRITYFVLALVLIILCVIWRSAKTPASFNANDIIDDVVFNDTNTMNATQINNFLNSFPSSCISPNNGFSSVDPTGYSPSNGFTYGGAVSAGQVIADAAQAYGINPQVLLTTLQKEQGLVRGDGPYGCGALAISASVGYGCLDGGSSYNYTNLSPALYYSNGNPVTSVNGTCVNTNLKVGFTQQVIRAAWLLSYSEQRSEGNIAWNIQKSNFPQPNDLWDNSDDPPSCYAYIGGRMTQGYRAMSNSPSGCGGTSDNVATYYDGSTIIDGTSVHLDTGATAALYDYTPHLSGNQNFYDIFTDWFGSTTERTCEVTSSDYLVPIYRLYSPKTSDHLFTPSNNERQSATTYTDYTYEGVNFNLYLTSSDNRVAVYRLLNTSTGEHFYTINQSEETSLLNRGFILEGTPFYAYVSSASGLAPVYRLYSGKINRHMFTSSSSERDALLANGWSDEGVAWYFKDNLMPVMRLYRNYSQAHFFTDNISEADQAFNTGTFDCEGVGFNASPSQGTGEVPVYRLYNTVTDEHFYTTSGSEKNSVLQSAGWTDEGVPFYEYSSSGSGLLPVYRLYDPSIGKHLFTASSDERSSLLSAGWTDEGISWYSSP